MDTDNPWPERASPDDQLEIAYGKTGSPHGDQSRSRPARRIAFPGPGPAGQGITTFRQKPPKRPLMRAGERRGLFRPRKSQHAAGVRREVPRDRFTKGLYWPTGDQAQ